jgi:hypothetical protein
VGLQPLACWDCGFEFRRGHDHSSRGVLPTVSCPCVWSRNLKNGEVKTRKWVVKASKEEASNVFRRVEFWVIMFCFQRKHAVSANWETSQYTRMYTAMLHVVHLVIYTSYVQLKHFLIKITCISLHVLVNFTARFSLSQINFAISLRDSDYECHTNEVSTKTLFRPWWYSFCVGDCKKGILKWIKVIFVHITKAYGHFTPGAKYTPIPVNKKQRGLQEQVWTILKKRPSYILEITPRFLGRPVLKLNYTNWAISD